MRMSIGRRPIGDGHPLFAIAEIGLNHGGSVERALELVDEAAAGGASAVKLQSLRANTLVGAHCPPPAHVSCDSLRDFFRTFELDESAHAAVAARTRARGLAFMSTPFDEAAVDMLERIGCDAYKIASGDLTHHRLIARAAATGKPLVLSTGMSELSEVFAALMCARKAGASQIALLHCVSAYPVPDGAQNLSAIRTLAHAFNVVVGFSDHGTNPLDLPVAVALGAAIYERHLFGGRERDAVDSAVSSTGAALAAAIQTAESVRRALGDGRRTCSEAEAANRTPSRRGLYAARDLAAGHVVGSGDMVALRPAEGLCASAWQQLLGSPLPRALRAGEPFTSQDIVGGAARDVDAA